MLFWNADKTYVKKEVFLERLSRELEKDELIIDGNYDSSMEMRFLWCDTVFFLDLPTEVCLESVRARRGKPRDDMPWIETEDDPEFTEYVASFGRAHRPKITELTEKYKKDTVIFTSRAEVNEYIEKLKKGSQI